MSDVMARFLDAIASKCADEHRQATELQDSHRHYDAHDHTCRAAALLDALTLGKEMQGREVEAEAKRVRDAREALA